MALVEIEEGILINPIIIAKAVKRGGYLDIFMIGKKIEGTQELYGHYSVWDSDSVLYNKLQCASIREVG